MTIRTRSGALDPGVEEAAPASPRRNLLAAAFARFNRHVAARAAGFGLLLAAFSFVTGPQLKNVLFRGGEVWDLMIMTLGGSMIDAFALAACLLIADEAVARGVGRLRSYATAATLAALVAAYVGSWWFHWTYVSRMDDPTEPWLAMVLPLGVLNSLVLAAGATFVYADLRRERESIARLQHAEMAREGHAREALGARLSAMQARVEPRFLLDTLAHVRRSYAHDRASASRMLDDLIAYLRAAMPQLRVAASTLGREVELAAAYMRVMTRRRGGEGTFGAAVADDIREAPFLPMIVLPLVQAVIADAGGRDPAVTIRASVATGVLRICLSAGNEAFAPNAPPEVVAAIRERLLAHYGPDAQLMLARIDEHTTQAMIEVPR